MTNGKLYEVSVTGMQKMKEDFEQQLKEKDKELSVSRQSCQYEVNDLKERIAELENKLLEVNLEFKNESSLHDALTEEYVEMQNRIAELEEEIVMYQCSAGEKALQLYIDEIEAKLKRYENPVAEFEATALYHNWQISIVDPDGFLELCDAHMAILNEKKNYRVIVLPEGGE